MSTNKTTLKYRVVQTYNPATKAKDARRPVLVDVATMSLGAVVDFALENGYMRGQTEVEKGNAQGFLEAIKVLAGMGYTVNINDWFRVKGYLTGTVGETGALTSANEYKVRIIALQELKQDKSGFSFTQEGDGAKVSISSVATVGSTSAGTWVKNKNVIATGSNLVFNKDIGDTVTATFEVEGEERTVDLTVNSSQYNSMELAWHEDLFYVAAGDPVEVTFTLHGGDASVNPKTITKKVTIAAS